MAFSTGGASSSTAKNSAIMSDAQKTVADLPEQLSENIGLEVTFTRYKLGTPVLYMLKCEVVRSLPPLIGPDGEVHESRSVVLASWTVKKRYSEMEEAHRQIAAKFGPYMESIPEFPPKVWSNALFNTEQQVQSRLRKLQAYFDKLLLYPNLRCSQELGKLLEIEPPGADALPHFRVCSFGIHQADQVYAVCEIGPAQAKLIEKKREKKGTPALFYHLVIKQVRQIGFSSESLVFLREDRLENSGKNMRFNLVLGRPSESYDLSISCSNYSGKNDDVLRIRLLAPSLEDILAEAGNSPQQVDQLLKRICTNCVHDVTTDPAGALESIRQSARSSHRSERPMSSNSTLRDHRGDNFEQQGDHRPGSHLKRRDVSGEQSPGPSSRMQRAGSYANSSGVPPHRERENSMSTSSNRMGFGMPRLSSGTSGFEGYSDSDMG